MRFAERILLKRGLRSDSFWTRPRIYGSALARIPLLIDSLVLSKSQFWPRARLEELVTLKLRAMARNAAHVPLWRDLMRERQIEPDALTAETLQKLPIISKKDFRMMDPNEYCDMSLAKRSVPDHTSGSTGRPFNFFFDWASELRSFAITERIVRSVPGPRLPVLYMRSRYRQGFTFYKHLWFYLRGFSSVPYRMDDLLAVFKKYRGKLVLYGYTSSIVEVARELKARGVRRPVQAVMATGENIFPSSRALVEEMLSPDFRMVYASREAGWLGFECEHKTMHLNEEWAYVEIVDDGGARVPDGVEGRVIVSCFEPRMMPLIRYEIGDRGKRMRSACKCGRTLDSIVMTGRTAEYIPFPDGRAASLLDISAALDGYAAAIRQFQILVKDEAEFVIRVLPAPRFEEMRDTMSEHLVRVIHPSARISWEIVDEIPEAASGKATYFIAQAKHHESR